MSIPLGSTPSSNPSAAPSATIVPTHFPHQPTSTAPVHPFLDTSQAPMNAVPIELDSTPVDVTVNRSGSWKTPQNLNSEGGVVGAIGGGFMKGVNSVKEGVQGVVGSVAGAAGGLTGASGLTKGVGGLKVAGDDPAVMDGPPGTPGPEDFAAVVASPVKGS